MALNCKLSKSIKALDTCQFGIGGVKRIALFNYDADIKVVGSARPQSKSQRESLSQKATTVSSTPFPAPTRA